MTITITSGWWILPMMATIASIWWCCKQDYRGDYNFTAVFTIPVAGFAISSAWMIYFALGWMLS